MTKLNRKISRESWAVVHESGKPREVIITLEPPSVLGFRAKGTRRTYRLTAEGCYMLAVKAHVEDERKKKLAEKKAKKKAKKRS